MDIFESEAALDAKLEEAARAQGEIEDQLESVTNEFERTCVELADSHRQISSLQDMLKNMVDAEKAKDKYIQVCHVQY